MALRVHRLSEHAVLPRRATAGAAGYDLCSAHNYVIEPHSKQVCLTDLAIAIPPEHYGRVGERSRIDFLYSQCAR
jgi:dUTP pyrophosphatase